MLNLLNSLDPLLLLISDIEFLGRGSKALCELSALATNLVPRKLEDLVDGLETAAAGLRQTEPHPQQSDQGDAGEEHHGTAVGHADKHLRYRLAVAVLIDEVEGHGYRAAQGAKSKGEDLGVDEVLD